MKQLYGIVTQLQRQTHRITQQKQQSTQKERGKSGITIPKK